MERKSRELAGAFPPVATFEAVDQYLEGVYRGTEEIKLKGDKFMRAFSITLEDSTCAFRRGKGEVVEPKKGDLVSVSGAVIERGLNKAQVGDLIRVTYLGKGASQHGAGKTNLFRVEAFDLVGA